MQILPKHLTSLSIAIILCVAFALRVVQLSSVPSGFHADEASFLLNATTLLHTARDEDNRFLPLTLTSLIDPKPALYSYLEIPFIFFFGPTVFAARLPAVLAGVLTIFLVFYLLKRLGYERLGLCVAAVLTFSPWHIVASRVTQEVILSLLFSLGACIYFVELLKKRTFLHGALFTFFSFVAMYNYHSAKIFLPLLFISWAIGAYVYKKVTVKIPLLIICLTVGAAILSFLVQESNSRFSAVGILGNKEPQILITEQISGGTPYAQPFILRLFYNKPVAYSLSVLKEYTSYFSPSFLLFTGGEPKRYMIPFHGLIYLFELPLLLMGIYLSIRKKHPLGWFVVAVAVLAPVPAALTYQETPSMIRSLPLCIALSFFIALTLEHILQQKHTWKILFAVVFLPFFIWQVGYFLMQLSVQQKAYRPWYRNTPYTTITEKLKVIGEKYPTIRVVNDLRPLYTYFALGGLLSTETLQSHPFEREKEQYVLEKFSFTKGNCDFGSLDENTLYVAETECRRSFNQSGKLQVVDTIRYEDGTAVYELLTYSAK